MVPVTGRAVLAELSWLFPARWGYAAGAGTVDLTGTGGDLPDDWLWSHALWPWSLCLGVLTVTSAVLGVLLGVRIRRTRAG